jgi:hypothetical protein
MKRGKEFKDKRGVSWWLLLLLTAAIILFIAYYFGGSIVDYIKTSSAGTNVNLGAVLGVENDKVWGPITKVMGLIFGAVPQLLVDSSGALGAVIVVIALWVLIVLMFGDIIKTFGTFSPNISWWIAVLIGIIGANLKLVTSLAFIFTAIFIPLGIFAAYAGLLSAFFVFFVVSWGIGSFGPFLMRRRAMREAESSTTLALATIRHYKDIGKELTGQSYTKGTKSWKP